MLSNYPNRGFRIFVVDLNVEQFSGFQPTCYSVQCDAYSTVRFPRNPQYRARSATLTVLWTEDIKTIQSTKTFEDFKNIYIHIIKQSFLRQLHGRRRLQAIDSRYRRLTFPELYRPGWIGVGVFCAATPSIYRARLDHQSFRPSALSLIILQRLENKLKCCSCALILAD